MNGFSIREIFEMAIETEKLGYKFYTNMAKKFKGNKGLKGLFDILAEKEKQHEKTFIELKKIVGDREPSNWEEVESFFRAVSESEFFLGKQKALPSMTHVKSIRDAVNYAMGFEKATLLYYIGLREEVREKHILDEIIREEKNHLTWLHKFRAGLKPQN